MQSTPTQAETDPHDMFVIEPDVVLAARADRPSPDKASPGKSLLDEGPTNPAEIILAVLSRSSTPEAQVAPNLPPAASVPPAKPAPPAASVSPVKSVPPVNAAFRATAATADAIADGIKAPVDVKVPSDIRLNSARPARGSWAKRSVVGFLFALGSVAAAEAWDHYGDTARQMMAVWTPVFTLPPSQPAATAQPAAIAQPAPTTAAAQPAMPAVQAAVTDQTPGPPAPAAVQPAQGAAAATPAAAPDQAQALQSMTQDLAAMGQQVEALKASIAQLKASQEQMAQQISRDVVRNAVARTSEVKPSEPRGRLSTQPRRPTRKPQRTSYAPSQPGPAYPPPMAAPAPMPQVTSDPDGDLVVRPPIPLR
jgi:hypothetical protein